MTGGQMGLELQIEQSSPMPLSGSFYCGSGELVALVGPSGAGKTSLMRILAGLTRPENGRVTVGTQTWCDTQRGIFLPAQRRHVGLVFQNYALMPHLSAQDNVALSLLHLSRAERQAQARRWLDHVGLSAEQQLRNPASLSGGQQQRVAVARALAREPQLMLLDEPFSAVDPMSRDGLYRLLADLRRELTIPIVLVTHDLHEARTLADHLVVMDAGQVLQQGTPAAIHNAPRNARVADLVGIQNRFEGQWQGPSEGRPGKGLLRWLPPNAAADQRWGATAAAAWSLLDMPVLTVRDKGKLPPGRAVHWVIPSDGITLLASNAPNQEGTYLAEVVEVRHLGEISLVTLELAAVPGARMRLTLAGGQRQDLVLGASLRIQLHLDLVHVMPVPSIPNNAHASVVLGQ